MITTAIIDPSLLIHTMDYAFIETHLFPWKLTYECGQGTNPALETSPETYGFACCFLVVLTSVYKLQCF